VSARQAAWRNRLDLLLVSAFRLLDRENIGTLNIGELDIEAKAQLLSRLLGQHDLQQICRLSVGQWLTLCHSDDETLPPPPASMDLRTARIVMFGDSLLNCYGARSSKDWGQILREHKNVDVECHVYPGKSIGELVANLCDYVLDRAQFDETTSSLHFQTTGTSSSGGMATSLPETMASCPLTSPPRLSCISRSRSMAWAASQQCSHAF
jgi:hypothetical protein